LTSMWRSSSTAGDTRLALYVCDVALQPMTSNDRIVDPSKTSGRANWVKTLVASGSRPSIYLLEKFEGYRRDAYEAEKRWIVELHKGGHALLNVPIPKY
jgi:hypothetical protein